MSRNTAPAWNTKYGSRRVRHDPPTLAEAIVAARDLTDEPGQQADIAASLMGLPREQVVAELAKMAPQSKIVSSVTFTTTRTGMQRAVIVERKPSRRIPSVGATGASGATVVRKLNSFR